MLHMNFFGIKGVKVTAPTQSPPHVDCKPYSYAGLEITCTDEKGEEQTQWIGLFADYADVSCLIVQQEVPVDDELVA